MSSNQTHEPSTHGSSCCHQATPTLLRSTTLNSLPLTQLPIPLPSDLVQNREVFIPHEVLNQLSKSLHHLTSSMQANNTHAPGNAESIHTIEDGTPNDESPLTVENSTPNVDYTDALSEASGQQLPSTSFGSIYTYSSLYLYITTTSTRRTKQKIISGDVLGKY